MRLILLLILSSTLGSVLAAPARQKFSTSLAQKKYDFSALQEFFLEYYDAKLTIKEINQLEAILYRTGIEVLDDYEENFLARFPSSSLRFVLGQKLYKSKKFNEALSYLSKVHPDHRYYPESRLIEAQIYHELQLLENRDKSYTQCLESSQKQEDKSENKKIKRYFRMLNEICQINQARHFFTAGKYQEAIRAYDKIPKKSYKWPYLLVEKAWAYYHLKDYNRALGLLVTYKSPLLSSYFLPEVEYLAALSYFKLCLYEDAQIIINQFYQVYRPRFLTLGQTLNQHRGSQTYFYEMTFKKSQFKTIQDDFLKKILVGSKKQIRFSLDANSLYRVQNEIKRIERNESPKVQARLIPHLKEVESNLTAKINYHLKVDIFSFLQGIPFISDELFKLNLEILARKKDLVYKNKELISKRSRGDLSHVQRSRFSYFWTFDGPFWADELGDYSLGLRSSCDVIPSAKTQDAESP